MRSITFIKSGVPVAGCGIEFLGKIEKARCELREVVL